MNFKQQVYSLLIKVYELVFGQPKPIGEPVELGVDANVVNPLRQRGDKAYQFQNCPQLLWASKLQNGWYTLRLCGPYVQWKESSIVTQEKYDWVNYPCVRFLLGRSGVVYEIRIDIKAIVKRGNNFFIGCDSPDWPYYVNSVVMAHLEALKFTGRRIYSHPVLVGKVLTNYGPQLFEELIDETVGQSA